MTETLRSAFEDSDNITGLLVRGTIGPTKDLTFAVESYDDEFGMALLKGKSEVFSLLVPTERFENWQLVQCALCDEDEPLGYHGWATVPFGPGNTDQRFVCQRHLADEFEHTCSSCGAWRSERYTGSFIGMEPTDYERLCDECRPPDEPDRYDD